METRHDLSVDHARLLSTGGGYASMDNSATGHPNSQQLRPPYGDLCRPPGADASTLSAAYHSRYLASMPLTTEKSVYTTNKAIYALQVIRLIELRLFSSIH
ncbi:BAH and coiled-coil domain-containing protein 1 [Caerostris extrusa]|uniref:BAH and coiled-coil domain-containing protein 1 n=1 Tax=Caerostris extrusa TaxID=172846 RepID=A0AAV4NB99_CAEEX|nr:BAH and coiled-coil domain-containing protein 1 [Caerostris extrusa]